MKTIKFKKEMMQAIKERRKTQTRRPVKSKEKIIIDGAIIYKSKYPLNKKIQIKNTNIFIKITDMKIQLVQSISNNDLKKEGVEPLPSGRGWYNPALPKGVVRLGSWCNTPQEAFMRYWNHIYENKADYLWENNPLVWVYEFERID